MSSGEAEEVFLALLEIAVQSHTRGAANVALALSGAWIRQFWHFFCKRWEADGLSPWPPLTASTIPI